MSADWATRSAGRLLTNRLSNDTDFGGLWGGPFSPYGGTYGYDNANGRQDYPPDIDTAAPPCEGVTSALRFRLPSEGYASCGQWGTMIPVTGPGESLTIQFRFFWDLNVYNTTYLSNVVTGAIQEGIKIFDIGGGDGGTSNDLKLVTVTQNQHRFLRQYQGPSSLGLYDAYPGQPGVYQNQIRDISGVQTCDYAAEGAVGPTGPRSVTGCAHFWPNEWTTLKLRLDLGARVTGAPSYVHARSRLYMARDGEDSVLLHDWNQSTPGYVPFFFNDPSLNNKYFVLYFFPYMTNKDARQLTPLGHVWYRDLIVDRSDIPDPVASGYVPVTHRSRIRIR
jgi:hypothetical protein